MATKISQEVPTTCKAYRYHRRGNPADVIVLDDKSKVPTELGKDDVLIKVTAVALNPVDWKLMKYLPFGARSPLVANDFSGTVVKSNSSRFASGDEVYGIVDAVTKILRGRGTLAEYIVAPASGCIKRPAALPAVDAAGLSLVGTTALGLSEVVDVKKHDHARVLVCGGSSAVGLMLVPILRNKGCYVAATCSAAKADIVTKRGAQQTYDYRHSSFQQTLRDDVRKSGQRFDYIIDCVDSYDVWLVSPDILNKEGLFASVGFDASQGLVPAVQRAVSYLFLPAWLGGVPTRYLRPPAHQSAERVAELGRLVDQGIVTPVVDSRFEFNEVKQAFERLQTNRATGKVIIKVSP